MKIQGRELKSDGSKVELCSKQVSSPGITVSDLFLEQGRLAEETSVRAQTVTALTLPSQTKCCFTSGIVMAASLAQPSRISSLPHLSAKHLLTRLA